jgi:hypothetical protein
MASKLTVYIDDSIRQSLKKEAAGSESISKLVNDALESYLSATLLRDLSLPDLTNDEYPSLSEVERKRPKARGSSDRIISNQRRGRDDRLS